MSSGAQTPMAAAARRNAARATPRLQTNNEASHNLRYSYVDTPVEMQRSTFEQYHQFSSPTNSTIDESPVTPASPNRVLPTYPHDTQATTNAQLSREKEQTQSPNEVHPAYFAPLSPDTHMQQQQRQNPHSTPAVEPPSPGPIPVKMQSGPNVAATRMVNDTFEPPPLAPVERRETYNPDSLAGPNGAPVENHRPGQVSHPNSSIDPHWKHGLCEPDTLCCMGLICPCMVYGKTMYRLSKKSQKQDPTDLLGYESCNGSCGLFAAACGFQCERRLCS